MYKTLLFTFIMLATIACNNDNSTQNASINTNNEGTVLTQQSSNTENTISPPQHNYEDGTYTWSRHDDPRIFFADFQKALKNRDQDAVYQMMNIPFECHDYYCKQVEELGQEEFDRRIPIKKGFRSYSINNKKEFYEKYDYLFSPKRIGEILEMSSVKTYEEIIREVKANNDPEELYEIFDMIEDERFTIGFYEFYIIVHYNNQGMYKLQQIPYQP